MLSVIYTVADIVGAIGVVVGLLFLVARSRSRRLAKLSHLFEPGTVMFEKPESFRGYSLSPSVRGVFCGRRTAVSVRGGRCGYVRFSIAAHSELPFQVRAKSYSLPYVFSVAQDALNLTVLLSLGSICLFHPSHRILLLLLPAAIGTPFLVSFLTGFGRIRNAPGWEDAPRLDVSYPDFVGLDFSSFYYNQTRLRELIDHEEIRDSLVNVIRGAGADHVRCPQGVPRSSKVLRRDPSWDGRVEAICFNRRGLLNPEFARKILSDILVACEKIEALTPSDIPKGIIRAESAEDTSPGAHR